MRRSSLVKIIGLITLLSFLAGCTAQHLQPGTQSTVPNRDNLPPAPTNEVPPPSRGNQAVYDLINNSQAAFDKGDWQGAIAMAERALRIDRRNPAIYLIIAKSYRALGENAQALQFVEQGLRYTGDTDTDNARELEWLDRALR